MNSSPCGQTGYKDCSTSMMTVAFRDLLALHSPHRLGAHVLIGTSSYKEDVGVFISDFLNEPTDPPSSFAARSTWMHLRSPTLATHPVQLFSPFQGSFMILLHNSWGVLFSPVSEPAKGMHPDRRMYTMTPRDHLSVSVRFCSRELQKAARFIILVRHEALLSKRAQWHVPFSRRRLQWASGLQTQAATGHTWSCRSCSAP